MSPRLRIASISVASAIAIGLCVAIGVAPPASAEPCTRRCRRSPTSCPPRPRLPTCPRRPTADRSGKGLPSANERAPLPKLVQIPRAILNALHPRSAQVQQQAGVAPSPTPPAPRTQQPPAAAQPVPEQPPLRRRRRRPPPGTSLVGWVTGPDSPNNTIEKFAITGTDLGIMWDNGDPGAHQVLMAFGDTYGYCSVHGQQWRYNTLMRSQDGSLANTISVPNGSVASQYSGSPLWARGPLQTDHQQHQVGAR